MHDLVKEIFVDAGATPDEIEAIDQSCRVLAEEVRKLIIGCSDLARPELVMPLRVLYVRVIEADMVKALHQYRIAGHA